MHLLCACKGNSYARASARIRGISAIKRTLVWCQPDGSSVMGRPRRKSNVHMGLFGTLLRENSGKTTLHKRHETHLDSTTELRENRARHERGRLGTGASHFSA